MCIQKAIGLKRKEISFFLLNSNFLGTTTMPNHKNYGLVIINVKF